MSNRKQSEYLSEEFKQKVILVLEDNDEEFETNWNETQNKLLKLEESTPSKINGYLNRYLNLSKENIGGYKDWICTHINSFSGRLSKLIIGTTALGFFGAIAVLEYDLGLADQKFPFKKTIIVVVFLLFNAS